MLGDFELGTRQLGQSSLDDEVPASYALGQSQSDILHTYQGYGQARCTIKQTYQGYGQCQAQIKHSYQGYGQCQGTILSGATRYAYAQTQSYMRVRINKHAQAQARIFTTTPNAQAQAWIFKGAGYAQAQAWVIYSIAWSQAQAQIKRIQLTRGWGQALAFIINKKKHGQAQGQIKAKYRGYGQAQTLINRPIKYGQAQGFINKSRGQGQAQARIISFKTLNHAQSQAKLITTSNQFAQAQSRVKAIYQAYAQTQAQIIGRVYAQAQGTIKTKYISCGQAMAHILGNTGYAQARAYIDDGLTVYLLDTASRIESPGSLGTPDIGPAWSMDLSDDFAPLSVDGSRWVYDNSVVNDPPDYGWAWPWSDINALDVSMYLEFSLGQNSYIEFDLRQEPDYVYVWYDYTTFDWELHGFGTSSNPTGNFEVVYGTTYSIRFTVAGDIARFKIWVTGDSEPSEWLVQQIDAAILDIPAGGVAIYIDNNEEPGATFSYFDNINVVGAIAPPPFFAGYGQVQAKIKGFNVPKFAQTTAFIAGQYFVRGQAQAKIKSIDNIKTGLAVARILLDEVSFGVFNTSNPYQDVVMNDFPAAYYTLNEPLLFAFNYNDSNMLYKDIAWDNVGLYDLERPYGSDNWGPYGGPLVRSFAVFSDPIGDQAFTQLPSFSAYWDDPTGIPGTQGDSGIISQNEFFEGFNYLYRYNGSLPISGTNDWVIEFWYRPLETPPVTDGTFPILRVGGPNADDAGAVQFDYADNKIKTSFGHGGSSGVGPAYNGVVAGTWYHILLSASFGSPTTTRLFINGLQVGSTTQVLNILNNTIFIHPNIVTGHVFLMDELALYNYDWTQGNDARVYVHYLAGLGFNAGSGQAQAYIIVPTATGQAQATIFNPWAKAQARALISTVPHKVAQAQAYIKGWNTGQAQAYITRAHIGAAQAQGKISKQGIQLGQASARINNTLPIGQAQALIDSERYLVAFNGYHLPGYAQEESIESIEDIKIYGEPYKDASLAEYRGLQNKNLTIRMLVMGENYLDCKNQIQLATTLLRSKRNGFTTLYINYQDRHFEAITHTIKTEATTSNIRKSEYTIEFETKPWLLSDTENTISGTDTLITTGRTLDNGGWTPTILRVTGTNVTVSGYTSTGDFTGFISISGAVTDFEVDTEAYETSDNGLLNTLDYQLYVGPGVTTFEVTGATDCTITYRDRWYL